MSNKYKIKEVRIEVRPGVILIAEIETITAIQALLNDLEKDSLTLSNPPSLPIKKDQNGTDSPFTNIANDADLDTEQLNNSKKILGFKDNIPQLLRVRTLPNTDAILLLLYALETGLKTKSIEYESFKDLYEGQNIKAGSPLSMTITNLKNSGYIDKKKYSTERVLNLSPKGQQKAIEVLKSSVK